MPLRLYALAASPPSPTSINSHLNVNIVLVSPKVPGNIGSVLRVSGNFGASSVVVVAPRCDALHEPDVYRLACDSPLLSSLLVVESLEDALGSSLSSIGFTRRGGAGRPVCPSLTTLLTTFPSLAPQACLLSDPIDRNNSPVSLVFGREESGLTDQEAALCSHLCAIPSNSAFPSLNLSHAVAVVLSQMFEMKENLIKIGNNNDSKGVSNTVWTSSCYGNFNSDFMSSPYSGNVATQREIDALYDRIVQLMEELGMDSRESSGGGNKSNHGRKRRAAGHIRALLMRSQASVAEVRALHGLMKRLEMQLR